MNNSELSMASAEEVLDAIDMWSKLDIRKSTPEEVRQAFKKTFDRIIVGRSAREMKTFQQFKGRAFYRIREMKPISDSISEFWALKDKYAGRNRCSFEKKSMLYTSLNGSTPFKELEVAHGQQVYAIKYNLKAGQELKLLYPFCTESSDEKPVFTEDALKSHQLVREFVSREFMKSSKDAEGYIYNLSASICDYIKMEENEENFDGFIYPSVVDIEKENVALFPHKALGKLEISEVRIVEVTPEEDWFADPRVKLHGLSFLYRGRSVYFKNHSKGVIKGDKVSWEPNSDLGCF